MTASPLQRALEKRTVSADGEVEAYWAAGAATLIAPTEKLLVFAAHGREPELSWLDRGGHWLHAWMQRFRRPERALRERAEAICRQAGEWRGDDEAALRERLRALALDCRKAVLGTPAAVQAQDAGLAGVFLAVEQINGFSPHVEQIMGALTLLDGRMAEMATGEGKTLTAAMAAIVAAWRGRPCHVVTANDYLAKRDAEIGQPLFAFCHVSVASIDGETAPQARGPAHAHDIVYCTARDLLGDHLRDGLALGKTPSRTRFALTAARHDGVAGSDGVVMRGIHQVIVDEADSVLIDEAVTPLIISSRRPDDFLDEAAQAAARLAAAMVPEEDFKLQRALRHVELTPAGRERLNAISEPLGPFWQNPARTRELVEMALYARHLMVRDQHYVIDEDKIVLVDELTGRLADQRTLSLGMQQILEATEGVPLSPPSEVSARLSFQRFFRLFPRLGGMTGTAAEARQEFARVYRLTTLKIPTHRPVRREILPLRLFADEAAKFDAIVSSALALCEAGRSVLIGMRSVRSSEALFAHFKAQRPDLMPRLLHAVNHAQESAIVSHAGEPGMLTIATNMAGRGTDIALADSVREQGGLHVIIGESNDFGRIDRQLVGRCARQGDPGSVQRFMAFDDELFVRFLPAWVRRLWQWQHSRHPRWDVRFAAFMLRLAQGRAEHLAFRMRQNILKQDIELDRSGL